MVANICQLIPSMTTSQNAKVKLVDRMHQIRTEQQKDQFGISWESPQQNSGRREMHQAIARGTVCDLVVDSYAHSSVDLPLEQCLPERHYAS
jgi:hypothetical protein